MDVIVTGGLLRLFQGLLAAAPEQVDEPEEARALDLTPKAITAAMAMLRSRVNGAIRRPSGLIATPHRN